MNSSSVQGRSNSSPWRSQRRRILFTRAARSANPHPRTARAKGASKRGAILKHAVGNSLIPVITQIGISFAGCIGGAVVTETVFTIPGIGAMLINAVKARDIPVVMGSVIFIALIVGVINLIVDLICAKVDPRIDLAA